MDFARDFSYFLLGLSSKEKANYLAFSLNCSIL